jgi:hypothetical protein
MGHKTCDKNGKEDIVIMKTKIVIPFLLIVVAILFAGNDGLYGSGGVPNPWGINYSPPRGTEWTGTLVITGQIADVSGLPGIGTWPPAFPDAIPVITGYSDQIVKIEFFVRLENAKRGSATFSGLAKDTNGYFFYALGDYANGRIGEALNKFLSDKVYPYLPGNGLNAKGALTDWTEDRNNVESQLTVDEYGRPRLTPESPLYYSAKIKVVTY